MMEKQTMSQQKNLPPVHLYSLEVNRIHQLLYDMEVQGEIFEKPFTVISADCLAAKLLTVSSLRENLLQEHDNVRLISALMIPYHLNITDDKSTDYILVSTIETVQEMPKKLSNVLFNVSNNLKAAIKVINEITDAEKDVNDYCDRGLVVFSGRPLQVPIFLQSWNEKKAVIRKTQELINKYSYLFNEINLNVLKAKLTAIKDKWQVLKSTKAEHQAAVPDIFCKICYTAQINVAIIPCGHTLCKNCLARLSNCPMCNRGVDDFLSIYL